MTKGEIFCVNLDDTKMPFDEIYDPDIREFFNASTLPSQLFNLDELNNPEVHESLLLETEFRMLKLNKLYQVMKMKSWY